MLSFFFKGGHGWDDNDQKGDGLDVQKRWTINNQLLGQRVTETVLAGSDVTNKERGTGPFFLFSFLYFGRGLRSQGPLAKGERGKVFDVGGQTSTAMSSFVP